MKTAVFGGSFCPVTLGHLDAIKRAAQIVDKLYVVIGVNAKKTYTISLEDRLALLRQAVKDIDNVVVDSTDGLMTDYCQKVGAEIMIKSVRNATDLQEVIDLTEINKRFWKGETVFLACDQKYSHISSSLVRELVSLGQPIDDLVPQGLSDKIVSLLKRGK